MHSIVNYFILLLIPSNIRSETCFTYDFEEDFYLLFSQIALCTTNFESWELGTYSELGIQSPHVDSTTFISPNGFMSCISSVNISDDDSSLMIAMEDGGVLEVNIYMEAEILTDQVIVNVYEIVEGENIVVAGSILGSGSQDFANGWHTLRVTLNKTGKFLIFFMAIGYTNSIILVDSFRYIPPGYTEEQCFIYSKSTEDPINPDEILDQIDSDEIAQTTDPNEITDPTDSDETQPTDPIDSDEIVQPIDSDENTDPTVSDEIHKPTDSSDTEEIGEPTDSDEIAESTNPDEIVQKTDSDEIQEPIDITESNEIVQPIDPDDIQGPTDTLTDSNEMQEPADTTNSDEIVQPTNSDEIVQPSDPDETQDSSDSDEIKQPIDLDETSLPKVTEEEELSQTDPLENDGSNSTALIVSVSVISTTVVVGLLCWYFYRLGTRKHLINVPLVQDYKSSPKLMIPRVTN